MSTQTAMDALPDPTANDTLAAVPHHTQHETVNDILGVLSRSVVYVKAFDPVGDGVTDDTTAVEAAHDYANLLGYPVSYAGLTTVALQADAQIAIKTSTDFAGCRIVILGGVDADPQADYSDFNELFIVSDDDCPVVEVTGAVDSSRLGTGSLTPTYGLFDGHGYALVTCDLQVPDSAKTGTQDYTQSFKINRNGVASHPLSTDISAHAAAISVTYRRTSKKTLTISGLSLTEGTWNHQQVLSIERCNVVVEDTTVLFTAPGTAFDNVHRIINIESASDITIRRFVTTGRPVTENSGSYCLRIQGGADIWVEGMNALTGWGATGCNDVSGIHYRGCVLNRIDCHSSMHNVFVTDCDLHEAGVIYGWGGGILSVRDCRAYQTAVVGLRTGHGGTWFGSVIVDNVEVNHPGTVTYYVVDMATQAMGASTDVHAPHTVRVTNITRTGKASGNNATIVPFRIQVRGATDVVYAPTAIEIAGIMSTTLPVHWRCIVQLDLLNMERAPGSTYTAVALSGIRPSVAATSTTGLVDFDSIRTPSSSVVLKLAVADCENFHAAIRLTNGPSIVIRDSSINGISTVTSGTRARVDIDGCRFHNGASGYTNPPVGGGRSGSSYFTSVTNSEFAADEAFDCSTVSLAFGNYVRPTATAPLIPAAATLTTWFTGFMAAGAFQT